MTGLVLFLCFECLFATWKTLLLFFPFCLFFAMAPEERTRQEVEWEFLRYQHPVLFTCFLNSCIKWLLQHWSNLHTPLLQMSLFQLLNMLLDLISYTSVYSKSSHWDVLWTQPDFQKRHQLKSNTQIQEVYSEITQLASSQFHAQQCLHYKVRMRNSCPNDASSDKTKELVRISDGKVQAIKMCFKKSTK